MQYTFYFESKFGAWGQNVKYLKFKLPDSTEFILSDEWIAAKIGKKRIGMQRLIFLKRNNYAYSYRVSVAVSSASNTASGEIVALRETKPQRTSIIILLSDFKNLRYPVQQNIPVEQVEISEQLLQDTFKYKVTIIRLDESQSGTEIPSKRDQILIVSDQLKSLFNTGNFADIIITDNKGRCMIMAHRNILAARSVYFRYMFQNNWLENKEGIIVFCDMQDKELKAIEEMLHYIYAGVVRPMKISDMLYLYMMSDQFLLDDLKEFLSKELLKRLNVENAVVIYILAGCVSDTDLRHGCLTVIENNFQRIHHTQFWKALHNKEGEYSSIQGYKEIINTLSEIINRRDN